MRSAAARDRRDCEDGSRYPELSLGIWQSSLLPMAAAAAAAVALVCAVAAMLLFRDATAFTMDVTLPGSSYAIPMAAIPGAIEARLFHASIGSALCFLVAISLTAAMMRSSARASFHVAVVALVLTLGVTTAFAVSLRGYSDYYRTLYQHGASAVASRKD